MCRSWIAALSVLVAACASTSATAPGSTVQPSTMPTNYKITFDDLAFTISAPIPPSTDFVKYRRAVDLHDDHLFNGSTGVVGLHLVWRLKRGGFDTEAGIVELQVIVYPAADYDVRSQDTLRSQVTLDVNRGLAKLGRSVDALPVEARAINGRTWLRYTLPVIGGANYVAPLSNNRYIDVQISLIGDTKSASSSKWLREANDLYERLVSSMRLEVSTNEDVSTRPGN